MPQAIHANARTTPRIRKEIQEAPASITNAELARRYGVHRHTIIALHSHIGSVLLPRHCCPPSL